MQEHQQHIVEEYIAAYNHKDVVGMVKHLHEELIFENITGGEVDLRLEGKAAFRQQAEQATAYFSERKQTPTAWKFEGGLVTVELDYQATLAMDFPNGMKAGEELKMKGKSVFQFAGDLIIKLQDIS
ncbi:MAG TPA: hypothetical protein DCE41_32245 [Cytophagales bacterium]|nr:hypothetical protein [Cytophagales bacterium]HAA20202.1 hypothetical protein [Cytophagales bacterium]HAP58947.1 hypothetical protein [Cytophagales bacterium]